MSPENFPVVSRNFGLFDFILRDRFLVPLNFVEVAAALVALVVVVFLFLPGTIRHLFLPQHLTKYRIRFARIKYTRSFLLSPKKRQLTFEKAIIGFVMYIGVP